MKARTKLQMRVVKLSNYLPDIENMMLNWGKVECLDHKGYATKSKVYCIDCGGSFSPNLITRKRAVCPHCNTKLNIELTRKRTDEQQVYVSTAAMYEEFQVIRNFEITAHYKTNEAPRYWCREILQHWILPNGKYETFGKNHTRSWHVDSWNGSMEIRKSYSRYYQSSNKYDVYPFRYHPKSEFKAEYKRYGIDKNLQGLTFLEAIKLLPDNPQAETLLKAKRYDLFGYYNIRAGSINHHWPSIKICLRNKYKIKDIQMWFDYLDLLKYFDKDMRSAHYVCPKDMKKEHDIYVKRKREKMRIDEMKRNYVQILKYFGEFDIATFSYPKSLNREYQILVERQKLDRLEKKKKELEEIDIKYRQFISSFLDMNISDKLIQITPLQNIEEFKKEGDVLCHCVYTNEYFKKDNCLILSARIEDNSIETIEIDLIKMSIIQSRGIRNSISEHHDRILKLMKRNMSQVKKRIIPKRKRRKVATKEKITA